MNPARSQNLCHQHQASVKLQLVFHLLFSLQLCHLLPPLTPPGSNSSCLFTQCQPLYAKCCTAFFKALTVRLKFFSSFSAFFMYNLCEKYYKPITVEYSIWRSVSIVSHLGYLCWIYEHASEMEVICM